MSAANFESFQAAPRELNNKTESALLLNSADLAMPQGSRSERRDNSKAIEDGHLVFTNIFESETVTRGFKRESQKGNTDAPVSGKPDGSAFNTFSINGDLTKLDEKKPTVAFLDTGVSDPISFEQYQLSHGQISALAASKNGFNSIILDIDSHPHNHVSERLNEIDKAIDSGKLPLGKGDVLNISIGNGRMMSYDELNKDLQKNSQQLEQLLSSQVPPLKIELPVTRENIENNRPALLKSLEILKSEKQEYAQALASNNALNSIESRGITVLTAAGNEGPDKIDLDDLTVKNQLASGDRKLSCDDPFSSTNSLTKNGDGAVGIYSELGESSQPNGNFIMMSGGHQINFNQADLAALDPAHNSHLPGKLPDNVYLEFDNKFVPRTREGIATIFQPLETAGTTKPAVLCGGSNPNSNSERVPLEINHNPLVLEAAGTSFSNIAWLKEHQAQLESEKQERNKLGH